MSLGLDMVVPLVRGDVNRGHDGDPARPVVDALVSSLIVLYAFEREDGFQMVAHRDLPRLGVDQATLAAAALDNLLGRLDDLQILERPDGCGMVRLDGNLEASILLVPQLWHQVAEILGDQVVVAVPARDVVLFCGGASQVATQSLQAARDRVLAVGDHKITKELFRFSAPAGAAGSWQVEPD